MIPEKQLALQLVQSGVLTREQVQQAVRERTPQQSFAQVIVERGWVPAMKVLEFDPDAFAESTVEDVTPSTVLDEPFVGLGQDSRPQMDDSGVVVEGEDHREDDGPMGYIVLYTNQLLRYAAEIGASDMHLEPRADGLLTRFRVDGRLHAPGDPIASELTAPVISRLKVLANLDIGENRMPQDGRFRASIGGRVFDFRVSTLPSIHGEKVVIRLLDRSSLVTDLTRLGFTPRLLARFNEMLGRSQGMILVTGPTGSGKTTTLYAALAATRDETKNVVTVEDPVEYELAGVTQTKVMPDIGLTFAAQLRAILRQDPDVILVGEIRDRETAEMAIRAALTGHLVLSTLHTNSAAAAVARLFDMEVPPYLLATSLTGVVAQRLARMICQQCRRKMADDDPEYEAALARLRLPVGTPLYHGAGCDVCNGSGHKGRIAIIELLEVDAEIRRAILKHQDATTLHDMAVQRGMTTLWQDGLDKLKRGLIPPEEAMRVLLSAEDEAVAEM